MKTSFASSIHFATLHRALVITDLQILVSNTLALSLTILILSNPSLFLHKWLPTEQYQQSIPWWYCRFFYQSHLEQKNRPESGSSERLHSWSSLSGTCLISLHQILKLWLTDFWILSFETYLCSHLHNRAVPFLRKQQNYLLHRAILALVASNLALLVRKLFQQFWQLKSSKEETLILTAQKHPSSS